MKRVLLAVALATSALPLRAETLSGSARAIDGDTLAFGERHVRLFGIDAPESAQTCQRDGTAWACGEEAARQLAGLVDGSRVECTGSENDTYGRLVATCWSGGYQINQSLVEYGWATAYREFGSAYIAEEARARAARLGIWGSSFDLPQTWRIANAPAPERPSAAEAPRRASLDRRVLGTGVYAGSCAIKGNHSKRGEWIYHLPGMPYYDATRPEAIFCTEAEAQAAGYRRARAR